MEGREWRGGRERRSEGEGGRGVKGREGEEE